MYNLTFSHPCTITIVGPTSSGKTYFLWKFLRELDKLLSPVPKHVILFYHEDQEVYKEFAKEGLITHKHHKVPSFEEIRKICQSFKNDSGSVLIFDDALRESSSMTMQLLYCEVILTLSIFFGI